MNGDVDHRSEQLEIDETNFRLKTNLLPGCGSDCSLFRLPQLRLTFELAMRRLEVNKI